MTDGPDIRADRCPDCGSANHFECDGTALGTRGPRVSDEAIRLLVDPVRLARSMAEIEAVDRSEAEDRKRERKAKRIADAVRAFAEFGEALPGVWVCLGCHALVNDREHHVRWHDSLNETARKAADADWRGRPIG